MPSIDVFHKIFVAQNLEEGAKLVLQQYFGTFLREVESQQGLPVGEIKVPPNENYTSRNAYDDIPGEELPKIVIISPGLIGTPKMSGNGQYRAIWRLGIAVATAAQTEEEAKFHCDIYGAVIRDIMLKRGGKALKARVEWIDEVYSGLPLGNAVRRYRAASIWFSVDKENVATKNGGPAAPDQDPYSYPIASTVRVNLVKEP